MASKDAVIRNALHVAKTYRPTMAGGGKRSSATIESAPQRQENEDFPEESDFRSWNPTNYKSWNDVPIINPQDLVGKKVGSLLADLTRAGGFFEGIDSSKIAEPETMMGGPGYPLLPESQQHKLGWAVQGKGRGTTKLTKGSDYIAVHAMNPDTHLSNISLANSIVKNAMAYVRDKRISPKDIVKLNKLIRSPGQQEEVQALKDFPGLDHPNAIPFLNGLNFPSRLRIADILSSSAAKSAGAPSIDKIRRETLDPNFAGVPYGSALFLLEFPKGAGEHLVNLQQSGLPIHPSYMWGMHGRIVGKFAHPVAPEILHQTWFDQKNEENKTKITPKGKPPNIRRSFEMGLPSTEITQEIADKLPRLPKDIQSGKAAQLALNAFNDQWQTTGGGGLGPETFSNAIRNSDASSTLTPYTAKDIRDMGKNFTGYKLKDGEVYFGLKNNTDYEKEYGFKHPDLTPSEKSLVSVINNEPGAKGIGGAPVVLKAIEHGATALDCFAVPTDKHPNGFLPDFYSHFGFEELGRIPFDPKYVTHDEKGRPKPLGEQQLADMKHEWSKTGWDESRHPLPSLAIMKWRGEDADRQDAVRRYVTQSAEDYRSGSDRQYVGRSTGAVQQGTGPSAVAPQGERGVGDGPGNLGSVGANNAPRSADRFTRTLTSTLSLQPHEMRSYGINPQDVEEAKAKLAPAANEQAFKDGGEVGETNENYVDPESKAIQDWQWKPLEQVQSQLGNLTEIPSHVVEFGKFMDRTAQKAATQGLSPRDLIKAYVITRASIQRQAVSADKVRATGFPLSPEITGKIRPEGAFGEWLQSPFGQSYLDAAERGQLNERAIADAVRTMAPFGKHETDIPDALRWAAANLPGKEGQVSQLVAAGREKASTPDEWRAFTKNIRGIGPSKSGFVASLMGRGDQPTLDARQIILHTGNPAKEASRFVQRQGGMGGAEAVNRLAARQQAMNLSLPPELSPYYQHLAHHAIWDKAGNEQTTHQDVMEAMQHAATGGKISEQHITQHPIAQIMKALGFKGLEDNRPSNSNDLTLDQKPINQAMELTRRKKVGQTSLGLAKKLIQ